MTALAAALTLREQWIPRRRAASITTVLAGALLISGCAQVSISLPFTPVPVTGQTFAVLICGSALGALEGAASAGLYVAAGALGAPVYAGHAHGLAVITSASGGYLFGFIAASFLSGLLAQRQWDRRFSSSLGAMLSGNLLIYLFGVPWLAHSLHVNGTRALELGLYPFIPGELIKIYVAAAVLPTAWRAAGRRTKRR